MENFKQNKIVSTEMSTINTYENGRKEIVYRRTKDDLNSFEEAYNHVANLLGNNELTYLTINKSYKKPNKLYVDFDMKEVLTEGKKEEETE